MNGDFVVDKGLELIFLPEHSQGLRFKVEVGNSGDKKAEVRVYLLAGDHFYPCLSLNPPKEPIELEDLRGNKVELQLTPFPFYPRIACKPNRMIRQLL